MKEADVGLEKIKVVIRSYEVGIFVVVQIYTDCLWHTKIDSEDNEVLVVSCFRDRWEVIVLIFRIFIRAVPFWIFDGWEVEVFINFFEVAKAVF